MFIAPGTQGLEELETKVLCPPADVEQRILDAGGMLQRKDIITEQLWHPNAAMIKNGISMRLRHVVDDQGGAKVEWVVKDKKPPISILDGSKEKLALKLRTEYELDDPSTTADQCRFSTIMQMLTLLGFTPRDRIVSERVTYLWRTVQYELRNITGYETSLGPLPVDLLPAKFLEIETAITEQQPLAASKQILVEAAGAIDIDPANFNPRDKRRVIQDHLMAVQMQQIQQRRKIPHRERKGASDQPSLYERMTDHIALIKSHLDASRAGLSDSTPCKKGKKA